MGKAKDTSIFKEYCHYLHKYKEKYGENNQGKDQSIVVEYSSPNTAKHLHA